MPSRHIGTQGYYTIQWFFEHCWDVYSASCFSTCTFRYPSNTNLVQWRHCLCVYGRICMLSGSRTLIPHLVVIYFIHCSSLSLYSKNSLQYLFLWHFTKCTDKLQARWLILMYVWCFFLLLFSITACELVDVCVCLVSLRLSAWDCSPHFLKCLHYAGGDCCSFSS